MFLRKFHYKVNSLKKRAEKYDHISRHVNVTSFKKYSEQKNEDYTHQTNITK
jgi:hypothetical protein